MNLDKAQAFLEELFSDEEGPEPGYDPVHLGAAVTITLAAIGGLYWLLWTLLVYEGGLEGKAVAVFRLVFTKATLKDLGFEAWAYQAGAFEGLLGNLGALAAAAVVVAVLRRLYKNPWTPTRG